MNSGEATAPVISLGRGADGDAALRESNAAAFVAEPPALRLQPAEAEHGHDHERGGCACGDCAGRGACGRQR